MKTCFDSMIVEGNTAYFFSGVSNGLYELDLNSYATRYLMSIPEENDDTEGLCLTIIKSIDDSIVMIPANAKALTIYGINSKNTETILLDDFSHVYYGGGRYGNKIFFIGLNNYNIGILDTISHEVRYINTYPQNIALTRNSEIEIYRKSYARKKSDLYIPCCRDPYFLKVNLEDETHKIINVEGFDGGFRGILYDGDSFWTTVYGSAKLVQWSENKVVNVFEYDDYIGKRFLVSDIVQIKDAIYLFPTHSEEGNVLSFDKNSNQWRIVSEFCKYNNSDGINLHIWKQEYPFVELDAEASRKFAFSGKKMELLTIHGDDRIEEHNIEISTEESTLNIHKRKTSEIYWRESDIHTIEVFINLLKQQ